MNGCNALPESVVETGMTLDRICREWKDMEMDKFFIRMGVKGSEEMPGKWDLEAEISHILLSGLGIMLSTDIVG